MKGRQRFFVGLPNSVYRQRVIFVAYSASKSSDLERDVISYITFEELFPKENNSADLIRNGFEEFWKEDIVQVIAKINYAASNFYYKSSDEEAKIIAAFVGVKQREIISILHNSRKMLSRQQLLANLRLAFLLASDDDKKKKVLGEEELFGKLIYRITDFMEETKGPDILPLPRAAAKKKLYLSFARNMVFNEPATLVLGLTRYWYIFNKVAYTKKYKKFGLKGKFKKATGTDFNALTAVGFAIWGFYSEPNREKRLSQPNEFIFNKNYFRKVNPSSKRKLLKALKNLSGDFKHFQTEFAMQPSKIGEHFSFNPFWRKPIIHSAKNAYYILDMKYLEERLGMGAFWFIFDSANTGEERKKVKGEWGNIFEGYVNQLVKETFIKKRQRVFSEIDGDETGGVDFIICYPDTLFFIEVTTKQVAYNQWIESNDSDLDKSLKRILIKDDKSKGRVIKLQECIEKVKTGTLKLEGVDVKKIKNFIPIVLFEKAPPMHRRLWHFYDNLLTNNGISDRKFLDDLDFWDIEELEMLFSDVLKGKSLPTILKEREEAGYFKDSIRNFYIIHRNHFDKHPLLKKAFKQMTDHIKKVLFKKSR